MNDNSLAARTSHQQVLARQMTSMPPMKKTVAEHDGRVEHGRLHLEIPVPSSLVLHLGRVAVSAAAAALHIRSEHTFSLPAPATGVPYRRSSSLEALRNT